MKFKSDENLPIDVVDLLKQEGHDALSVTDQQLAGHPDTDVAEVCQTEQRVLVTLDLDFSDIRSYPLRHHCTTTGTSDNFVDSTIDNTSDRTVGYRVTHRTVMDRRRIAGSYSRRKPMTMESKL